MTYKVTIMIYKVTITSPVSGAWDTEQTPVGWRAIHPDYDGAEDGCTEMVYANSIEELVEEIRFWDGESEDDI